MILSMIVILAVIAADIATKYAVALNLAGGEAVTVIPHVLDFEYVENRGAAFGMLADHRWVFLVFSSVAILGILAYLIVKRPKRRILRFSLALIAGGGVGNMIERIAHGYVTDFINATFVDFYVFNVADACVTVGCVLLILWMIVDTAREAKVRKLAAAKAQETPDAGDADEAADAGAADEADTAKASDGPTSTDGDSDE